MARFDDRAKRICEFRIAVMDKIPAAFEETPFVHRDIPRDLLYPGFIGMWRDPGNFVATALQMDKEQYVVRARFKITSHF